MDTTATTFTNRSNAKRAAEAMITKGTAPAVDYGIKPRDDGRFEIVWKTAPRANEITDGFPEETSEADELAEADKPAAATTEEVETEIAEAASPATELATADNAMWARAGHDPADQALKDHKTWLAGQTELAPTDAAPEPAPAATERATAEAAPQPAPEAEAAPQRAPAPAEGEPEPDPFPVGAYVHVGARVLTKTVGSITHWSNERDPTALGGDRL